MASSLGYIKKGAVYLSELEMYLCSLCNKAFSTKSHLQRHQKSTHRQSSGSSCLVCSQHFYRKSVLRKEHIRKHADEGYEAPASHTYPIFQKSFHYRGHLSEHLKIHPATTSSLSTGVLLARYRDLLKPGSLETLTRVRHTQW